MPKARAIRTAEEASRIPADEEITIDIAPVDEPMLDTPAIDVATLAARRPAGDVTIKSLEARIVGRFEGVGTELFPDQADDGLRRVFLCVLTLDTGAVIVPLR